MGFVHIQDAALDLLRAEVQLRHKLPITISYLLVNAEPRIKKVLFRIIKPL